MKLRVAWIQARPGKDKSSAVQQLTSDYLKRITRYSVIESMELGSEEALLRAADRSVLVALDARGKQMSSEELAEFLEGQAGYLLPNTDVQINFYNGRPIGVEIPPSVILTVVDTEPGIKNATATNTFKPAKMETGITVQVPPFINKGEKIKIDTAEGTYMERA